MSTEMASRVVPGTSDAISRSSPRMRLIRVDLPTFGRPTTAMRITPGACSSGSGAGSGCGKCTSMASSRSDRQSVVEGKGGSVRVDLGGRRLIKQKKKSYKVEQEN